jgi:hypothetical protein
LSSDPTLSPEQHRALEEARARARKILSAAKVAAFNGWTIGAFAVLTILFGLRNPAVLALGVGMGVVARNELRGRTMLRRFEAAGARLLGRNQLGLMGLVVAYCLWCIYRVQTAPPDPEMQQIQDLAGVGADLIRQLSLVLYACVIAATGLFQGLNARYYFRRVGMVETYLSETPTWVVDLQRSATLD